MVLPVIYVYMDDGIRYFFAWNIKLNELNPHLRDSGFDCWNDTFYGFNLESSKFRLSEIFHEFMKAFWFGKSFILSNLCIREF